MMVAIQALERRTEALKEKEAEIADLPKIPISRRGWKPWKDWCSQRRRWPRSNAHKFREKGYGQFFHSICS